jgi:hypothetical protein
MKRKLPLRESTRKETVMDSLEWASIIDNVRNLYASEATLELLIDWERVLSDADIYAFKNWKYAEIVDGPNVGRYTVSVTLMWPENLTPDPRGAKRLLPIGCDVKFRKAKMKTPIEVKNYDDYQEGTKYPKIVEQNVLLVTISIPAETLKKAREGSIYVAGENIDIADLEDAYEKGYDKKMNRVDNQNNSDMGMM